MQPRAFQTFCGILREKFCCGSSEQTEAAIQQSRTFALRDSCYFNDLDEDELERMINCSHNQQSQESTRGMGAGGGTAGEQSFSFSGAAETRIYGPSIIELADAKQDGRTENDWTA